MREDRSLDTTDPIGLPPEDIAPRPYASRVGIDVSGLSHRGKVRHNNEDHFLVARVGRSLHTLFSNLPEGEVPNRFDENGWVMMVADGMGGAAGGEVASSMAISTLVNIFLDVPDWIMQLDDDRATEIMRRAVSYYKKVDTALSERAAADPILQGMGSTMTLGYSLANDLFVVHVGDSRLYLMRNGNLQQLTKDQTHAQALADAGMIKREEVATHRLRHVLTNALGGNVDTVEVEIQRARLHDGDRLLLCTDGLTDMVDDDAIAEVMLQARQPGTACKSLVERALANGGRDNVTVIVADCGVAAE